jgi:hypothetical protein
MKTPQASRGGRRRASFMLLLLLLAASPSSAAAFPLAPETDPNITQATWGFNPWMERYNAASVDPTVVTHVMLTGGCLPVEEGGSNFYQDAGTGFRQRCAELGIACQCRPAIKPEKWNPPQADKSIFNGSEECVWFIRLLLDEVRRGLITVGGISAKCSYQDPAVFEEAAALGVPLFLMGINKPYEGELEYDWPQPTGFIGTDQAFLGRTMARLLQQLRPEGGTFGFVTDWKSAGMMRRRLGFVREIAKQNEQDDRPHHWTEVTYPFNTSIRGFAQCPYIECMMERLADPATGTDPNAIITLFQSPLRKAGYTDWVDRYRWRNMTLIAMDALDYLSYLSTGYVDGLVGQITFEMGTRSAEVLSAVAARGLGGPGGVVLPPDTHLFESRLVSYNLIPLELDKVYPVELEENLLENLTSVGYICFAVILSSALLCLVWTVYHRDNMVVRAAQPFFLLILLGGIVILASTILPLSFDDGGTVNDDDIMSETFAVGICMSLPWLAFTGFAVIFSALFSKTWRVNKLFHAQTSHARTQVAYLDVLGPFAVIFSCNTIVLVCWTIADPLTYTRQVGDGTDFWNREIESFGACRSNDSALPFLLPLAFINFAVLAIACWQAFEARNLESEFAESKYIGFSVASLFQAFLTGLPIVAVVKDEPRAFYLVLVLTIFVLSEAILLLIFLPKMYLAHQYAGMSEAERRKAMSEGIKKSARSATNHKNSSSDSSSVHGGTSKFFRDRAAEARAAIPEEVSPESVHTTGGVADSNSNATSETERASETARGGVDEDSSHGATEPVTDSTSAATSMQTTHK